MPVGSDKTFKFLCPVHVAFCPVFDPAFSEQVYGEYLLSFM